MTCQHWGGLSLVGGWIVLASVPATLQVPVFPFVVERAWIEKADVQTNRPELIYFTVQNRGNRTVTAFGLRVEIRLADGSTTQTTWTMDSALSMREGDRQGLAPDARVTTDMGLVPSSSALDVAATPALVVFDDDTAFGDETFIARLFAYRAVHQRFWRLLDRTVSDVTQSITDPDAALRAIDAELEAAGDADVRKTAVYLEMRRRMSFDAITLLKQTPEQVLQELKRRARTERANVEAHAQRRYR